MIRVVLVDLGDTLVHGDAVYPHAREAMESICEFETAGGDPLEVALVSDFEMPSSGEESELGEIFARYVAILERFELRDLFEPVDERVTLSSHAGVFKPDRRVFELALERLGTEAGLDECVFVTENREHVAACRGYGMSALRFDPAGAPDADFADWSVAPLLVARLVDPDSELDLQSALGVRLAATEGLELVSLEGRTGRGTVSGRARKWCPLRDPELGDLDGVHVQLPVRIEMDVDPQGRVGLLESDEPPPEALAEAVHFVRGLARHRRVALDPERPEPGTSHAVTTDASGRRYLRRTRFSTV